MKVLLPPLLSSWLVLSLPISALANKGTTRDDVVAFSDEANICNAVEDGTTFDPSKSDCDIYVMDPSFIPMLKGRGNDNAGVKLRLQSKKDKIFHEGPVLFDDELYFVSNRFGRDKHAKITWGVTSPPKLRQFIKIMKLDLKTNKLEELDTEPYIQMANGMTKTADRENILVLSQGYNTTGGAIFVLDRKTLKAKPLLTSFFGREFNSPNDIEITSDGILFFSDPPYGFEQGFRSYENPALGSNVYRYDTNTKMLTILATTPVRPNGVALFDDRKSGNGCTLFLSDTGFETAPYESRDIQSPRGLDGFGDSTIYTMKDKTNGCFAPKDGPWTQQPLIPTTTGIQDGMEVHQSAELFFYCDGNGLWIWSIPLYKLIGFVKLPSGCTQVMFPQKIGVHNVFILAETQLFEITLNFQDGEESCANE